MSYINANYPIVNQGNFDKPVGSVTVYTSEYPSLGYPTWMMVPIVGHDVVRSGPKLKGFDLQYIPVEDGSIKLPNPTQAGNAWDRMLQEKEAMRKGILLEVIQSIAKL